MASQQQVRRENAAEAEAKVVRVEKDRVPKLKTHFESITVEKEQPTDDKPQGQEKRRPSLEEISDLRSQGQQNSIEAINAAEERYHKAKQDLGEKHKPQRTKGYHSSSKEEQEKNTTKSAADYAATAKNTAVDTTKSAAEYAAKQAGAAKNTVVDTTKSAAEYAAGKAKSATGYVSEKAVAAKDASVEVGTGVKDEAAVAGWGAAHYTLDKVAAATKKAADVTSSLVAYTGEKAVAAKDVVAGYVGETKDAVVAAEEKAAEYAARKKMEAKRDMEDSKASQYTGEGEEGIYSAVEEKGQRGWEAEEGGGILKAIGETIVEIGQTTKDLFIGGGGVVYPKPVSETGAAEVEVEARGGAPVIQHNTTTTISETKINNKY